MVECVKCITNLKFLPDYRPQEVILKIPKCSKIQNYPRSGKTRPDIIPSVIGQIKEEERIKRISKVQKMYDVLEGISERMAEKIKTYMTLVARTDTLPSCLGVLAIPVITGPE